MDVHIRKGKKISKANKKQNHKYCRGGGGGGDEHPGVGYPLQNRS